MRQRIQLRYSLPLFLVVGLVAVVFFRQLPTTVQNLDSGEVVANAFGLNVIHPPGYPLYLWIQYAWTHLFPFGSVFWRAAFLNALFSLGVLAIAGLKMRRIALYAACVLMPLAFSKIFWTYALLPDVFMLNCLVLAGLCTLYLHAPDSRYRVLGLCFLFALGATNHLSVVFASPLVVHAILKDRTSIRILALAAVATGSFIAVAYLSLLLLHTDSIYSWGSLHTLGDLARHFLRSDYGTLQLSGKATGGNFLENLGLLARIVILQTPLSLGFACVPVFKKFTGSAISSRFYVVVGSLAGYALIFLALANMDSSTPERLLLERFFLFPLVLLAVLAGYGLNALKKPLSRPVGLTLLAIGLCSSAWNYLAFQQDTDFAQNTIVEDYARNLLGMISDDARAIVIVDSDTKVFGLRYLQIVKSEHSQVIVLPIGSVFDRRQLDKIKSLRPELKIDPDYDKGPDSRDIFKHVVDPNIAKFDFYFTRDVNPSSYKVTFQGLGRKITVGSGVAFDQASAARISGSSGVEGMASSSEFNEYKALYAEYAYYYLKRGLEVRSRADSLKYFTLALKAVPYCIPALINICALKKASGESNQECLGEVESLREREFNYF
ncbi:MAG: DUF2723 domain-containing protein [Deltaproteobacteria bacterium]|nr:DUF2723 domain-containing protein [Deltaproteobacteria bacterium]